MKWNIFERKWAQLRAKLRRQWAKFADHDPELARSQREFLYGPNRDEAEKHLDQMLTKI